MAFNRTVENCHEALTFLLAGGEVLAGKLLAARRLLSATRDMICVHTRNERTHPERGRFRHDARNQ